MKTNGLAKAALAAIGQGFKVYPVEAKGKGPYTKVATDGFNSATADEEATRKTWRTYPHCNVGTPTGELFWVLDVEKDGLEDLARLVEENGPLPKTPTARTGGGGRHYFFEADSRVGCATGIGGLSIDVKGRGGAVVLPGSIHESGNAYRWEVSPDEVAFARAPRWLIEFVTRKNSKPGARVVEESRDWDSPGAVEGERNDKLCRLVGSHLRRHGDSEELRDLAIAWGKTCDPPLSKSQVRRTVEGLAKKHKESQEAEEEATPEKKPSKVKFELIPASQLGRGDAITWLWEGYLARGFITLLVGLWKSGKTTLLAYLLREMATGGDIAGAILAVKVAIITEEGSGLWARRRDDIGLGDHISFNVRPFKTRPSLAQWCDYLSQAAEAAKAGAFDVLVVDTWPACNPVDDENDSQATTAALKPLFPICDAGAAVLLVHHPKKGDAGEGQASRGSGALPGCVDIIIELRRFNTSDSVDRRRKLTGHSRFDETPREVVVELTDDGYRLVGTVGQARRVDRQQAIAEALGAGDWLTGDEIAKGWSNPDIPKPSRSAIYADLDAGFEAGLWRREGSGKKGDPYRYATLAEDVVEEEDREDVFVFGGEEDEQSNDS